MSARAWASRAALLASAPSITQRINTWPLGARPAHLSLDQVQARGSRCGTAQARQWRQARSHARVVSQKTRKGLSAKRSFMARVSA